MYNNYKTLLKNITKISSDKRFVCGPVEIYPNTDHTGGHAVTLVKSKDEIYYIIDDNANISTLSNYIKNHL